MSSASAAKSDPVAVILAAGMGTRLQAVHGERPKGFVALGGEPVIARSVRLLRAAGVREFVFVVGWREEAYRTWCAREVPGARCIANPAFATTGSLRSLLLGAAAVPGRDLVVAESDLIYERRAADVLLAGPNDVILASGPTASRDEVWVYADARGGLAGLSKIPRAGATPVGELVGLSRMSPALVAALREAEPRLPPAAHYEDGLTAVAAEHPVGLRVLGDLVWAEIDDPGHLERARNLVWPRILEADTRRGAPR